MAVNQWQIEWFSPRVQSFEQDIVRHTEGAFCFTEMMRLIHPNEVVIALRQFVQDNRQPQK